jgi:hypothetical protein
VEASGAANAEFAAAAAEAAAAWAATRRRTFWSKKKQRESRKHDLFGQRRSSVRAGNMTFLVKEEAA